MENEEYLNKAMGLFNSKPKKFGSIITPKITKTEWQEQLIFCKRLKNEYPEVLFRSDIQSAGKMSPQMQNIKQIIDPCNGWPDVMIYFPQYGLNGLVFVGLAIELKSLTASLSGEHYHNQLLMHERLRKLGWCVHVAKGADAAMDIFLDYYIITE